MSVLNVILFLFSIGFVSCREHAPVLLWSTQTTADSFPRVPALTKLSSSDFTDYLLKRIKVENPTILLFVEENLSVEDFSWRDLNENGAYPSLRNITKSADETAFISSVHEPYRAVQNLQKHGYLWKYFDDDDDEEYFNSLQTSQSLIFEVKLREPDTLEDRPDLLKRHDEEMAKIYLDFLDRWSNILVIYTGNHTSWTDSELGRFKREERDINATQTDDAPTSTLVIKDAKNIFMMTMTAPIIFRSDKVDNFSINKVIGDPTIDNSELRVRFDFKNSDESVNFKFSSEQGWWALSSIEIQQKELRPTIDVGAPRNFSFFCNPKVVFRNGTTSLTFENFQAQAWVEGKSFGPVIHCIPYFSIGIWSGMIIVAILAIVLGSGIIMIMDINTNDRFDDPKGKTITITATD